MKGLLTAALAALAIPAQANNCAPRELVVDRLASKYAETPRMEGLGSNNTVFEVFASESGSWTMLVTTSNGFSCLVASGQDFHTIAPAALRLPPNL